MLTIRSYLHDRHPHFAHAQQSPVHLASMNGRHYYAFVEGVTPLGGGKHVTEEEIAEIKKHGAVFKAIKHEAMMRIEKVAPIWRQCNCLFMIESIGKKARRSNEDVSLLEEAQNCFANINAIRACANRIEQALLEGKKVDYLTDAYWEDTATVASTEDRDS